MEYPDSKGSWTRCNLPRYERLFRPRSMAVSLHSALLHPDLRHRATRFPRALFQPPSRSLQLMPITSCWCRCASAARHLILSVGCWFGGNLWRQLRCDYASSCQLSALLKVRFDQPEIQLPKVKEPSESPLCGFTLRRQAGITPTSPNLWKTNKNCEAGPDSYSPYKKLKAKPSTSQSTFLPLSDSVVTARNLKTFLIGLPSIPAT